MFDVVQGAVVYDIVVDHATLALMDLEKGGVGCAVQLTGSIDERWMRIFQRERRESRDLSRFELNPSSGIVRFVREPGSDPADVIDALDTLDGMLQRVNRLASRPDR